MKESQYILNAIERGRRKGIIEAGREDLLTVLALRFGSPLLEDVRYLVEGTNDPDILSRWLTAALRVGSLAEFRAAMTSAAQP